MTGGPGAAAVGAADVLLRPMRPDDAEPTCDLAYATFAALDAEQGRPLNERSEAQRRRSVARHAHLQRTDPDGCWVAELDGEPVGVALALRRESLWFLSLLTVRPGLQAAGVGRRLIDAALGTAGERGLLMSSSDPRALRRYASAGFALLPGYTFSGRLDRALLPAAAGVRDGDLDRDGEFVQQLVTSLRGASYGPDLEVMASSPGRLLVLPDRGYAVARPGALACLGAVDEEAARTLLWAALAEASAVPVDGTAGGSHDGEVEVEGVMGPQQWAVQVALAARLSARPDTSVCVRGWDPPVAWLPSGAYG